MDIVIIILPFLYLQPLAGPAILKSNLEKHGYSCKLIDWNFKLSKHAESQGISWRDYVLKCTDGKDLSSDGNDELNSMIQIWIDEIKQYNPKWIGLSFNNIKYHKATEENLLLPLRQAFPDIKIVGGGSSFILENIEYGDELIEKNYIDYCIKGEAEEAIIQLLKNKTWNNQTPMKRLKNIDEYPAPDYSDLLENNLENSEVYLANFPIIGTRGCIRNCTFCMDVFKGAVKRDHTKVVDEMTKLNNQYGVKKFFFNDPLVNSNSTYLINLANGIIENKRLGLMSKDVRFHGNMCCLPKRDNDALMYKRLSEAGSNGVSVGIESGSPQVRIDMNKKINDEDIFYMFEQLAKNDLWLVFHVLVGYVTETDEDFDMTIDLVDKASKIVNNKITVDLGAMFQFNSLDIWKTKGVKDDGHGSWYYKDNTCINRVKRWMKLFRFCKEKKLITSIYYNTIVYQQLLNYENSYNIDPIKQEWKELVYDKI
jgi:hypothetical protein